jgi:hypothetical protein
MYKYNDIPAMQKVTENIDEHLSTDSNKSDFYRIGIEVYVGTFTDVSGPDFVIDPQDEKGIAIFREFASKMAEHYKSLPK